MVKRRSMIYMILIMFSMCGQIFGFCSTFLLGNVISFRTVTHNILRNYRNDFITIRINSTFIRSHELANNIGKIDWSGATFTQNTG